MKESLIQKLEKSWNKLFILGFATLAVGCSKEKDSAKERDFPLGDGRYKLSKVEYHVKHESSRGTTTNYKHDDPGAEFNQDPKHPFGVLVEWKENKIFELRYSGIFYIKFSVANRGIDHRGHEFYCQEGTAKFSWVISGSGDLEDVKNPVKVSDDCSLAFFNISSDVKEYKTFKIKSRGIPEGFMIEMERKPYQDGPLKTTLHQTKMTFERIKKATF